jgi:AbiU2
MSQASVATARRSEFESLYAPLRDDAMWAHAKWQEWLQLFSSGQGRVDLLNRAALSFFSMMRFVFVHEAIISLSRLTDAPGTGKRSNLTVERLIDFLDDPAEAGLRADLEARLERARTSLTDARAIRNRRLGPLDLATSVEQQVGLPEGPIVGDITRALAELRDILNALERHFDLPTVMYDQFVHPSGALTLLRRLKMAEAYERHVAAGRIVQDEDDLRLPSRNDV